MQPIDWQPSLGNEVVPDLHRNASNASHGSFHSGSEHEPSYRYGHDNLADLPVHDFTAGPSHTSSDHYLDVHLGYSEQPPAMVQTLNNGMSFSRVYDNAAYSTAGF